MLVLVLGRLWLCLAVCIPSLCCHFSQQSPPSIFLMCLYQFSLSSLSSLALLSLSLSHPLLAAGTLCVLSWLLLALCREYPSSTVLFGLSTFPKCSFFYLWTFPVFFPFCLVKKEIEREPTVSCWENCKPNAWHGRWERFFSLTATVFFIISRL